MPDAADRPNVLWICTDQHRFDALGCTGPPVLETPTIDSLADEGVRFEHAYAQSPVCTPSRASFLTGRYPRTTRCRQNGQNLPRDERLVTRLLADTGYECGLSGKLHVSSIDTSVASTAEREPARRVEDGYGTYRWAGTPERGEHHEWLASRDASTEKTPVEGSKYVVRGLAPEDHHTTWCADRAVEFVETRGETPWSFSLNFFDPHQPFDPPAAYLDRYLDRLDEVPAPDYEPGELDEKPLFQEMQRRGDTGYDATAMDAREHRLIRAAYYAMVELVDDAVGRVVDALERTGQREDTLVVFTADHGELLGDHGIYRKGPQFYDPAIRVPLIVAGPGVAPGGRVSEAFVELVDLAPTLLEAVGEDPHPGMQGRSFWPLLRGETDEHRRDVYCEFYNAQPYEADWTAPDEVDEEALFSRARDPAGVASRTANATMLRTADYKLVALHGLPGGELYDLRADPTETTNRWDDPAYESVKARLLARLTDRMAWTVDPLPERTGGY